MSVCPSSPVNVCVSVIRGAYVDNLADAVDRLLIKHGKGLSEFFSYLVVDVMRKEDLGRHLSASPTFGMIRPK